MFKRNISIKARQFFILTTLFLLSNPTSAQNDNCCYIDRLCSTSQEWVKGYYAFQNNQCAVTSQQQPATSEDIDNCCYIDRQCTTNEEWVNGYWAYQNNQCAATSQAQPATVSSTPARSSASVKIDNCCFSGWQCHTDDDWSKGYWAFQQNQCDASQTQWQPNDSQSRRNNNRPGHNNGQSQQNNNQPRHNGNQPRRNDNQPQHTDNQPQQTDYPPQASDPPQEQNVDQPQQNDDPPQNEGEYSAVISGDQKVGSTVETVAEDGTPVNVIRITKEEFYRDVCQAYPDYPNCG